MRNKVNAISVNYFEMVVMAKINNICVFYLVACQLPISVELKAIEIGGAAATSECRRHDKFR